VITPFDENLWAARLRYDLDTAAVAREDFRRLRAANVRVLDRTAAADRQRIGLHAVHGERTVGQLIAGWVDHDRAHLAQIRRILAAG